MNDNETKEPTTGNPGNAPTSPVDALRIMILQLLAEPGRPYPIHETMIRFPPDPDAPMTTTQRLSDKVWLLTWIYGQEGNRFVQLDVRVPTKYCSACFGLVRSIMQEIMGEIYPAGVPDDMMNLFTRLHKDEDIKSQRRNAVTYQFHLAPALFDSYRVIQEIGRKAQERIDSMAFVPEAGTLRRALESGSYKVKLDSTHPVLSRA